MTKLARWATVEGHLVQWLRKVLLVASGADGEESAKVALTREGLLEAYRALVAKLGLPEDWVDPPEFAIRTYVYYKDPNPPEPVLLNSFFLEDLVAARELLKERKAPPTLRYYLGILRPEPAGDLLRDRRALDEAVSPAWTPLGAWPGPSRSPLVLLQQAAVNVAFRETAAERLVGINGPPGTGKTTLLRDLIAGVLTERAEAMAKFDDPEEAFAHAGQKLRVGDAWLHLYRLHPTLRGYEIVVASSNNKAVENVSREIPSMAAIAEDATDLRYFKTLSDALHDSDTWGAIAAVLGNAQNRARFRQVFWWDDDKGFNSYLRAALGQPPQVQATEPGRGTITRLPMIVEAERPPSSHEEALRRWQQARRRFFDAIKTAQNWRSYLETLRAELATLPQLRQAEARAQAALKEANKRLGNLAAQATDAQDRVKITSNRCQQLDQDIRAHKASKPGFLARLFKTAPAREWSRQLASLCNARAQADSELRDAMETLHRNEEALRECRSEIAKHRETLQKSRQERQEIERRVQEAQQVYGVIVVDDSFFSLENSKRQLLTPWFPPAAQRARQDVLVAAMALHRAFVDAAARPLRHNLAALMNVFATQSMRDSDKQALLPDLWASLFLVVPVVSTTFASVYRMLGRLPVGSLGWLLVDEAGQAVPQAAIGALLRCQRAVIVGDPAQLEPVVVLPDNLIGSICSHFGVDAQQWAAPVVSVQALADSASAYTTEFETRYGSRTAGVPLLVHRRCSEPMFGISNAIAYSGLMVLHKKQEVSRIKKVLGPSKWLHVEGTGVDKWCEQEGDVVVDLLRQLATAQVEPDLYIITPFVIVADRLRQKVRESGVLDGWINDDPWLWTNERIGTVHTAQGREAEAVILVLGAPHPGQTGAREWAGRRPNLLNVAVTRAKEALYVIGNRRLWRTAGCFAELDERLDRRS